MRRWLLGLAVLVVLVAAGYAIAAGRRGLFALDQSVVFDGGWRVLAGQVPYRDFVAPVGPVAFWMQAGVFCSLGVTLHSSLATAAILNALAAVLVMAVVWRSVPRSVGLTVTAGVLTAIWFTPPSGLPTAEHTGSLLALVAFAALVEGLVGARGGRWAELTGLLAGGNVVLAALAKQNVGLAAGIGCATVIAVTGVLRREAAWRRVTGWFCLGAGCAGTLFALWLVAWSAPSRFVEHVVRIPLVAAPERLFGDRWRLLVVPWSGAGPLLPRVALVTGVLAAVGALVTAPRRAERPDRSNRSDRADRTDRTERWVVSAALAVGAWLAQNVLTLSANNQPEAAFPFVGVVLGCGFGSLLVALDSRYGRCRRPRLLRGLVLAAAVIAALVVGWRGFAVSWQRTVHEPLTEARTYAPLAADPLRPMLWAEPTVYESRAVPKAAIEELVRVLEESDRRFFVFPERIALYGLLGQRSPQPLLWFHPGLTYDPARTDELDRWIVESLRRHGVERVVVERASWFGADEILADFPRLAALLDERFVPERRIGPFEIWIEDTRSREVTD